MVVFAFKHKEQDRVAVVVARDQEDAFKQLAIGEAGGDEEDADIDHAKQWWKIEASRPATVAGPVITADVNASEGYELHLEEQ